MRTPTKRILSIALAICLCVTMVPIMTMQAAATSYDNTHTNTGNQAFDIVAVAQTQVGYQEGPNNDNKYGASFGHNNVAWCAYFISWCAKEAGISDSIIHRQGIASPFSDYFNIPNTHSSGDYFPKPGDLVFYGPDSDGDHYHVGLVETVDPSTGYITTIEGNTNNTGSSEGYVVYRHTRHYQYSTICCYGTPNYESTTAPDKPTITTTTAYYAEASDISISWNGVAGNSYYWISVWRDGELIVNKSMGSKTAYTLENAQKGEYKFSVSANNSAGTSGGTTYLFLVGRAPKKPTITTITAYYAEGSDISISWNGVVGNSYYWISVWRDGELIVNKSMGSKTVYTLENAQKGEYKFSVSANNGTGTSGGATCLFLVGLAPGKPVFIGVESTYPIGDNILISWNAVVGNVYYWIVAYKDGEKFADQMLGNATSYSIPSAAEGQYIIYISANNGAGSSGLVDCQFRVGNNQYLVTYDANGGTNAPESQAKIHGEDLVLSNSVPTRNGYTFLGWATSSTAIEPEYQPGDCFTIDSDIILYAVWEKNPVTLSRIEVASMPSKTVYIIGERLDTTGLTLKATYSDGSTQTITSGYTTSGFDSSTAGEKTVTVSFGGKSTSFKVTVEEAEEVDPNAPQIVVDSKKASCGSTVEINVEIINNPGFSVLNVAFIYDTEYLTLLEVENHLSTMTMTSGSTVVWDAVENYTGNGVLCTLKFEIAEDAPEGEYEIQVLFISASNDEFEELNMSGVSGTLEICNILYGDVNGDGKIASVDLAMLRKYLASVDPITGTSSIVVKAGADCNGDGKITSIDLAMLRKYLASVDPITGESTVILGPR